MMWSLGAILHAATMFPSNQIKTEVSIQSTIIMPPGNGIVDIAQGRIVVNDDSITPVQITVRAQDTTLRKIMTKGQIWDLNTTVQGDITIIVSVNGTPTQIIRLQL